MMEVSKSASRSIKDYLSQKQIDSPVRVTMASSCGGTRLSLAIDKAKDTDLSFDNDGFTIVVDKALSDSCGTITVDYLENPSNSCGCASGGSGKGGGGYFKLTSEKPLPTSNSCSCSCSSGSCS
jgi:Fe-S cluster assembly iron-binding protein IscA